MRKEVQSLPVGEHGRGIYTPLLVCQASLLLFIPSLFFFFVSVLRHMGIDRPAPGTGYVLTTLVNVVILLI